MLVLFVRSFDKDIHENLGNGHDLGSKFKKSLAIFNDSIKR